MRHNNKYRKYCLGQLESHNDLFAMLMMDLEPNFEHVQVNTHPLIDGVIDVLKPYGGQEMTDAKRDEDESRFMKFQPR